MHPAQTRMAGATKKLRPPPFDFDVFDAQRLNSEVAIEIAIGGLEAYLAHPAADVGQVVEEMLRKRNLLEFALSGEALSKSSVIFSTFLQSGK